MFSLLKIKVTGYKMLSDDFTIDFIPQARVNITNLDISEIIEIDKNLYTYNLIALTGNNSSGKTTTLDLIKKVLELIKTGRWSYNKYDFNSDKINIHIEFYLDKNIYIYESIILPLNNLINYEITSQFCKIENEILKVARYDGICGKNYINKLDFIEDKTKSLLTDTSKLIFLNKDQLHIYNIQESFTNNIVNSFCDSLNYLNKDLTTEIIKLFDESIEYINFDGNNSINFKRFNQDEILITKNDLINLLSAGTIRGINLYIRIILLLKTGGIMIIDEIENSFHKNVVNNLLYLIKNPKININKSQIIFTTQYVEILDTFSRRDNIFILNKTSNKINIDNLYLKYQIRTEILKSKQFNNNTFNTLLNYDQLMKVNRLIKNNLNC